MMWWVMGDSAELLENQRFTEGVKYGWWCDGWSTFQKMPIGTSSIVEKPSKFETSAVGTDFIFFN